MSYALKLYSYSGDKVRINKQSYLTKINETNIRALKPIGMHSLEVTIQADDQLWLANYASIKIDRLHYFYITNKQEKQASVMTLTLTEDPLMTFREEIGNLYGLVERSGGKTDEATNKTSWQYSSHLADPNVVMESYRETGAKNIGSTLKDPTYILTTITR